MSMDKKDKVIKALEFCTSPKVVDTCYGECPYAVADDDYRCRDMKLDALALLKEQDEEHRRLLSWLGKFCRHIDNGDAWLTDEENIAFFKEKMKQQFGWDTD